MHTRTTAVIISGVYLFGPMLFAETEQMRTPVGNVPIITESNFLDMLTGKGGPEEEVVRSLENLEVETSSNSFSSLFEEEQGPLVVETKTLNYLKVANTTMPVATPTVSSDYGWRTPPCDGCSADHKGVDFTPGYGEPVFAITDGMVVEMGAGGGYGNYVVLHHLVGNAEGGVDEWKSLYAHLKNDSIPEEMIIGSVVKTGDTIGAVGSTGMSTGPHLHFELLINGEHVDPMPLLGTYEVVIVTEEDIEDYMFLGETFKVVETVVTYE